MKHLPSEVHPAETGQRVVQPGGCCGAEQGWGTSFRASECTWPWESVCTGRQGCWNQLKVWQPGEGRGGWGGRIISLFLTLVSKQKTVSFVLKIQDYFEQRKQIKNGHHNILLISFKKLIRLQRHSTERVHGPLPWMDAENPHVNQLVIAESV